MEQFEIVATVKKLLQCRPGWTPRITGWRSSSHHTRRMAQRGCANFMPIENVDDGSGLSLDNDLATRARNVELDLYKGRGVCKKVVKEL